MIRHLCLIKYKDPAAVDAALQAQIEAIYQDFVQHIPGLKSMETGRDLALLEGNYDLAICATFEDEASFKAYSIHPAHMDVLFPVLGAHLEGWTTAQFHID